MFKFITRLSAKRGQKAREERDYRDLRGPFAEALESELARFDTLTKAVVNRRR